MLRRLGLFAAAAAFTIVAASGAIAQDRRVKIINESSYDIFEFYASNVKSESWEEDILGEDILPAGYSVMIDIDDGTEHCQYDFRAVFSDGEEAVTEGVNVCEISEFTYND
jgi:hypothetical protein